MTKNKVLLLVSILTAIIAGLLLVNPRKETSIDKLNNIRVSHVAAVSSGDSSAPQRADGISAQSEKIQNEFKRCFKKDAKVESFESMKAALLQQKDYSAPLLNEETFELETADKKNLVVQHIPQEENKNIVRVFSINPADGLPDRIKDFPNMAADVSLRLKGALSLGSLKGKSSSTVQNAYDGSMLSLEEKDNKIIRIHLITNNFDFECKNQSCVCLTKEY